MSTVAEIEAAIETLPEREFATLAVWFGEKQAARVDAALERAVQAGRFDAMAEKALCDVEAGKAVPLHEFLCRS